MMNENEGDKEISAEPSQEELDLAMAQEFGAIETADVIAAEGSNESGSNAEAFIPVETHLPRELNDTQVKSIIESVLFASTHPISFAQLRAVFSDTNVESEHLREILGNLERDLTGGERGILLEEVAMGYQLRTKVENAGWLRKLVKARPFKLSGPALEVLSIIAYKQPLVKSEIDEIRGVESGHLVRALIEKNIVKFAGKSELPGKPMLYATTKQFLELFGLRNIRELPTLSEIDKLMPEGIGEINEIEGETLGSLADKIAIAPGKSYSEAETELLSITDALSGISTSSEFFEQEKIRERDKRDNERAQDLRERQIVGEVLADTDVRWLLKFDAKIEARIAEEAALQAQAQVQAETSDQAPAESVKSLEDSFAEAEVAEAAAKMDAEKEAKPSKNVSQSKRRDVASHAAEAAAAATALWDDTPSEKEL